MAVLAVSGCSATHARSAAIPKPSAGAPSNSTQDDAAKIRVDGDAPQHRRCRALIESGDLVAPFWVDNEHFDRARKEHAHSAAQALAAYRTALETRGFPQRDLHVAYADYSVTWRKSAPIPVWIVIRYGALGMSTMSSRPVRTDDIAILNDSDLRSRAIIEALPSRCR